MKDAKHQALITRINRKDWWHVKPSDPLAYSKRGKFYTSTFTESEFYGQHATAKPERVTVTNPLVGDEPTVQKLLFGKFTPPPDEDYDARWELDRKMKDAALAKGYDAIVIMSAPRFDIYRREGWLPLHMELNILKPVGA